MADWSELPKELLQLISDKLNSEFYLTRFRSVCSTWRSSIPKPHPYHHFPMNLPPFFYFNDSDIHKLSKHSIFLIKPPTTPNQQPNHLPWLVRISPTSNGEFNLWHPLLFHHRIPFKFLDFNQFSVFDLGQIYIRGLLYPNSSSTVYRYYHRSVVTFQGELVKDIVTHEYAGHLVMLRCGDNGWTKIPNVATFNQDICIFNGRPCVTDRTGRTLMIGSDLSIHLVAEPVFRANGRGTVYIMLENESELLLVHKYKDGGDDSDDAYDDDDDDDNDELVRIDVFRLDQKEKKWLKLPNLGDMVLFLGQGYSFVASASDLGFDNGNFVIHCNHIFAAVSEMSIFHLDQQRNSPLSDYPDYFKLVGPPPEWITCRCL